MFKARGWVVGLLLTGGIGILGGCGGGPTGRNDSSGLRGKVVNAANPDQGVAGALVRVEGMETGVTTGADGSYQLTGLPRGPISLIVDLPPNSDYAGAHLKVSLREGETLPLDITLLPDNLPTDPSQIEVYPSQYTLGIQESVHFRAAVTSASGDFLAVHPTWTVEVEEGVPIVGVVSREGIFIGTTPGSGKVVAQVGDLRGEAQVQVVADDELARIVLVPPWDLFMRGGQERLLLAFGINGAGQMLPGFQPEWKVEPPELGMLTPVEDLSPEELERLLRGYGPPYMEPGGPGDPDRPVTHSESEMIRDFPEIIPEAVSVRRFTAENASGEGRITVSFQGQTAHREVQVQARGTLTEVRLEPQEVKVAVGRTVNFFAGGVNGEGWPIPGLEFSWELEQGLGELHDIWFLAEDGTDGAPPPPQSGEEPGADGVAWPPDPTYPCFWDDGHSGRAFVAHTEGQDRLTVTVHDPVTDVTLQATATIEVTPEPVLEKLFLYPEEATVAPGEEIFFSARAVDGVGELVGVDFEWSVSEGLGVLLEAPTPLMEDTDNTGTSTARPDLWPWPPEGYSERLLQATDHETEGTVTVTAYQSNTQREVTAQAKVRVVERPEEPGEEETSGGDPN